MPYYTHLDYLRYPHDVIIIIIAAHQARARRLSHDGNTGWSSLHEKESLVGKQTLGEESMSGAQAMSSSSWGGLDLHILIRDVQSSSVFLIMRGNTAITYAGPSASTHGTTQSALSLGQFEIVMNIHDDARSASSGIVDPLIMITPGTEAGDRQEPCPDLFLPLATTRTTSEPS